MTRPAQVAYNELPSLPRSLGLNTSLTRLKVGSYVISLRA